MTCHYQDLGSASDWLKQVSLVAEPITEKYYPEHDHHQYGMEHKVI